VFEYGSDIRVRGTDLWLDSRRKKPFAFVSHAHADHAGRHERILATPATLALARERRDLRRRSMKRPPRSEPEDHPLEFGEKLCLNGTTLTLFPAGHVLGSAQILVERDGRRLLYSGDVCTQPGAAAEEIEVPRADVLIMECTYGLPSHRFPPRDEVVEQLISFVEAALAAGETPVLLCYALGKGQEALRIVTRRGFPAAAEEETWHLAKVYEQFGVEFGEYRRLDSPARAGEVVITAKVEKVRRFLSRPSTTAALTGWAVGPHRYRARRADTAIPLSDHSDFDGLLGYASAVDPEVVYILHGPREFGKHLVREGFRVGDLRDRPGAS